MNPRRYRLEQLALACALSAGGLVVAAALIAGGLSEAVLRTLGGPK